MVGHNPSVNGGLISLVILSQLYTGKFHRPFFPSLCVGNYLDIKSE